MLPAKYELAYEMTYEIYQRFNLYRKKNLKLMF